MVRCSPTRASAIFISLCVLRTLEALSLSSSPSSRSSLRLKDSTAPVTVIADARRFGKAEEAGQSQTSSKPVVSADARPRDSQSPKVASKAEPGLDLGGALAGIWSAVSDGAVTGYCIVDYQAKSGWNTLQKVSTEGFAKGSEFVGQHPTEAKSAGAAVLLLLLAKAAMGGASMVSCRCLCSRAHGLDI